MTIYLLIDATFEERSKRSVNKNSIVKFSWVASNVNGLHLLKAAQRMTLSNQLRDRSLMKGPCNEQHNVVDHVAVGDVIEEEGQGPRGLVPHVLEFSY